MGSKVKDGQRHSARRSKMVNISFCGQSERWSKMVKDGQRCHPPEKDIFRSTAPVAQVCPSANPYLDKSSPACGCLPRQPRELTSSAPVTPECSGQSALRYLPGYQISTPGIWVGKSVWSVMLPALLGRAVSTHRSCRRIQVSNPRSSQSVFLGLRHWPARSELTRSIPTDQTNIEPMVSLKETVRNSF